VKITRARARIRKKAAAILRNFRRFSQITLKYHNLAVSLGAGNETFIAKIGADTADHEPLKGS
jgi:hypothetical protein